jgi:hypothetical protein
MFSPLSSGGTGRLYNTNSNKAIAISPFTVLLFARY